MRWLQNMCFDLSTLHSFRFSRVRRTLLLVLDKVRTSDILNRNKRTKNDPCCHNSRSWICWVRNFPWFRVVYQNPFFFVLTLMVSVGGLTLYFSLLSEGDDAAKNWMLKASIKAWFRLRISQFIQWVKLQICTLNVSNWPKRLFMFIELGLARRSGEAEKSVIILAHNYSTIPLENNVYACPTDL